MYKANPALTDLRRCRLSVSIATWLPTPAWVSPAQHGPTLRITWRVFLISCGPPDLPARHFGFTVASAPVITEHSCQNNYSCARRPECKYQTCWKGWNLNCTSIQWSIICSDNRFWSTLCAFYSFWKHGFGVTERWKNRKHDVWLLIYHGIDTVM